jgi:hypothetical protein
MVMAGWKKGKTTTFGNQRDLLFWSDQDTQNKREDERNRRGKKKRNENESKDQRKQNENPPKTAELTTKADTELPKSTHDDSRLNRPRKSAPGDAVEWQDWKVV